MSNTNDNSTLSPAGSDNVKPQPLRKISDIPDTHCDKEVLALLKETLNYHTGDHHTFFVFGASVQFFSYYLSCQFRLA